MKRNIGNSIFLYWFILLIWQNLFDSSLRGSADTLVKFVLLFYLLVCFFRSRTMRAKSTTGVVLFIITLAVLLLVNEVFSPYFKFQHTLFYFFPSIYAFCVFVLGAGIGISPQEMQSVNKKIIFVVFLAVLYTALFDPTQFSNALRNTNGYGNELHAFFISMYEFALYLFYAITCCIKEIEENGEYRDRFRGKYYFLMIVFFFVMILTFSRTIIACCIVYLVVYAALCRRSRAGRFIMLIGVLAIIVCLASPQLRQYLFETVWKNGESHSRERLYNIAVETFRGFPLSRKLFGQGVGVTKAFFSEKAGFPSIHNGYLQILFYYGWVGIIWLVVLAAAQLRMIIRFFRYDKKVAAESLALLVAAFLSMVPTTVIVFHSSIDSFFLTSFFIVVPKFRMNYIMHQIEKAKEGG